jgi:hypothetical protein
MNRLDLIDKYRRSFSASLDDIYKRNSHVKTIREGFQIVS